MKITRKAFESELNEIGPAVHELMLLGGRVPAVMADRYGTWLRRHDSTAFNVALNKAHLAHAKKDGDQAYAHRIISKLWAIDNPHESRRVIAEEGSRPETEHLF